MVEDNRSSSNTAMETDDRAKVAAAAVSVIPFSCIICFDEFHSSERPPMVLPCGHTYVCLPCTKRLKRCMECREPLFLPASQTNNSSKNNHQSSKIAQVQQRSQTRFNQHHENKTPSNPSNTTPQPPTPLPIPKNLVLLSMMEAAERQKRSNVQTEATPKVTSSSPSRLEADDEDEDDTEYDLNKIITGMASLSGPCGTYAVREQKGLEVFPLDPRKSERNVDIEVPNLDDEEEDMQVDQEEEADDDDDSSCCSSSSSSSEEQDCDASSLVCFGEGQAQQDDCNSIVEMEQQDSFEPDKDESHEKSSADESSIVQSSRLSFKLSPACKGLPEQLREQHPSQAQHSAVRRLEYGQTVQVVSFYNGVAKLARDTGFIAASPSQLVKVGEPLDESCRLQGLLDTVSCRGKDLEKTIDENNSIVQGLQRQIERAFETEPSHPIISLRNSEVVSAENRPPITRLSPQTPPSSGGPHASPTLPALQTPKKNPSFELLTPTQATTSIIDLLAPSTSCKVSPSTAPHPRTPTNTTIRIGFADSLGPAMPRYADNLSMDDADHIAQDMNHSNQSGQGGVGFGCGSSAAELFGENFSVSRGDSNDGGDCYDCGSQPGPPPYRSTPTPSQSSSSSSNAGVNHHRYQHNVTSGSGSSGSGDRSGIAPSLNPSFSASFDVVDFRTGMSCHRALNVASSKLGRSPKPAPRRQVRTMGDHRGVGIAHPIRSLQKRQMPMTLPSYTTPNGEEVSWYKE